MIKEFEIGKLYRITKYKIYPFGTYEPWTGGETAFTYLGCPTKEDVLNILSADALKRMRGLYRLDRIKMMLGKEKIELYFYDEFLFEEITT